MGLIVLVGLVGFLCGCGSGFLAAVLIHEHLSQNPDELDRRR